MQGRTMAKMAAACALCVIGGPMLVYAVTPDPDELFKRYNPDLQRRVLRERDARLAQQQEFLDKLHEYSKADKPIWTVAAEEQKKQEREIAAERSRIREELERQKREMEGEQRKATTA